MKPLREQNFYEVLEVSPDASPEQLARAYALAKRHFSGASLGSYSLFDSAERTEVLARIEDAWRTLSNREQRARYDREVLGRAPAPAGPDPTSSPPASASAPAVSSAPSLALTEVTGAALRARRESIGVPLQEIARNTRISIAYLQFIEEDHVKGLPHDAYLRGYLTQYAKAVGLDPHTVAEGYVRHAKQLRGQQS
ncbi:MAG: helix-turn-helix domain-containing protein [Nitrospirota bacterium]